MFSLDKSLDRETQKTRVNYYNIRLQTLFRIEEMFYSNSITPLIRRIHMIHIWDSVEISGLV